jgi:hypothetical protein
MDDKTKSDIVDAVIDLATAHSSNLFPTAKYGGTVFLTDPDTQGSFIAGVFAYADHVTVEFSNGANFDDPSGVLDGKGKARRHIKLRSVDDITDKNVAGFLDQALST